MNGPLLRLDRLGKTYPDTARAGRRFRSFIQLLTRGASQGGTRVLSDISLEVRPGESVAIIGENGAGKSTLLKIITGVLSPTTGTMESRGTRAALLELGAGFNPEYSGLDNLRMNAALLGLARTEVQSRLDDILAFADIGNAIHEPVKHYSSGMVVRLGFAVVAAVRPDLLITDEVLAVGDESFQKKCIRWMEDYLDQGGTLLMVSHNVYQVQKLCRHACWLHDGRIRRSGDVFDVTQAYLAWHERKDARNRSGESRHGGQGNYRVESLKVTPDEAGVTRLSMGEELALDLVLDSPDDRRPVAAVGIVRADGTPVYGVASDSDGFELQRLAANRYGCRLRFPDLQILPGGYHVRAHAFDPEGLRLQDTLEAEFSVAGESRELGLVRLEHRWEAPELEPGESTADTVPGAGERP